MSTHTSFPRSVLETEACVPLYRTECPNKAKSNAASCRAMHVCAEEISAKPGRAYSLTNRLRSLRAALATSRCEQLPTKSQVSDRQAPRPWQSSCRSALTESRGSVEGHAPSLEARHRPKHPGGTSPGGIALAVAHRAGIKPGPRDCFPNNWGEGEI
jgi:hypothetical protein